MSAKRVCLLMLLLLYVLLSTSQIRGQEASISPVKRALIKELTEVTQVANKYAEVSSGMMTEAGVIDDAERLKVKEEIAGTYGSFSERLLNLFFERMSVAELIEQIYYPLYDKYFTEGELRDMIAFYRTPTGAKMIEITPQLLQESMQRSNEFLNPTIIELAAEILEEDEKRLREIERTKED